MFHRVQYFDFRNRDNYIGPTIVRKFLRYQSIDYSIHYLDDKSDYQYWETEFSPMDAKSFIELEAERNIALSRLVIEEDIYTALKEKCEKRLKRIEKLYHVVGKGYCDKANSMRKKVYNKLHTQRYKVQRLREIVKGYNFSALDGGKEIA